MNSSNPRIFETLTLEQFNAATLALSTPVDKTNSDQYPQAGREFDLDIAKFLLVPIHLSIIWTVLITQINIVVDNSVRFTSVRLAAIVYEYRNEPLRESVRETTEVKSKVFRTRAAPIAVKVSHGIHPPPCQDTSLITMISI